MAKTVVLRVGESCQLRLGKDRIRYAGMPSEDVYSIVQVKWEFLYRGYSWNLFYPRQKQDITIDGVSLYVESVNPDEIRLRVEG